MDNQEKLVITVVGMGYVGMSIAVLLARNYKVYAVDIIQEKLDLINNRISPIQDEEIQRVLSSQDITLKATFDSKMAYRKSNMIIVATPTDFCDRDNGFDTSSVDNVVNSVTQINPKATIVIKSTVPIGFIDGLIKRTGNNNIIFSPEFLREGKALYDNLYPSRIIVGADLKDVRMVKAANLFVSIMKKGAKKKNVKSYLMGITEAEALKLFSNAYLALRVSFFNEIDTFAMVNSLDAKKIIQGVCMDPRIGDYYNNPSFGYGGYCLPKDTKQLLVCYKGVPQKIMQAIVEANIIRKNVVSDEIIKRIKKRLYINSKGDMERKGIVGVYRIIMKSKSDNYRQSALYDIIQRLIKNEINIIIYEPLLENEEKFWNGSVVNELQTFKKMADVIIANRYADELDDVIEKVYTRDIFRRD